MSRTRAASPRLCSYEIYTPQWYNGTSMAQMLGMMGFVQTAKPVLCDYYE